MVSNEALAALSRFTIDTSFPIRIRTMSRSPV